MSINMYLRRVSDADAARYRRDPDTIFTATVGSTIGGAAWPPDWDNVFGDASIHAALGRPRGFFGRLRTWLIKRAVKNSLSKQIEQLNKVKAAVAGRPANMSLADIPSPDTIVDLHKSWQIIHYVLTGTPDSGLAPLNLLLVGGEEVGSDLGYGPARLIDARTMSDFATALKAFDLSSALNRLNVERMAAAGVYCVQDNDEPDGQLSELEADLRHYLPALKDFAASAAAARQGALVWMG